MNDDDWMKNYEQDKKAVWFIVGIILGGIGGLVVHWILSAQ